MNRKVAIAGVALSDVGKVDNKNAYELMAQASRRALADTGLIPPTSTGSGRPVWARYATDVAEYLGIKPRWVDSTSVGGAAWEVMASHAADAIAQGHADVVLLDLRVDRTKRPAGKGLRTANLDWGSRGPQQWEAPYGTP